MARSPLMSRLLELARQVHEAETRGDESPARAFEPESAVSRRAFLGGAGAAAGLALLRPGDLAVALAARQPRIGIIGGGIAGLNAALTLHDAGYASTIFEAAGSVGGRMHSNMDGFWQDGQTSEWCGELIDSGHTTIFSLARRFNLRLVDRIKAQPAGAQDTFYVHRAYYPASQVAADFARLNRVLQSQIKAAPFPTTYQTHTATGRQLDSMSIRQWIDRYVHSGHTSRLGTLLDNAYCEEYGLDTSEQSALNLVYLLGYQPSSGGFSIYGTSDERFHIAGGNQRLPLAIAARLQRAHPACTIHTGWRLTSIATNRDRTITCRFETASGPRSQTFDRVILTVPFSVLRTLDYRDAGFDARKRTAITELGYGTSTKFNLQFTSRFWNQRGRWPGISDGNIYTDLPFQSAWDATRGQPGAAGILVLFTGGEHARAIKTASPYLAERDARNTDRHVRSALGQLDTVWPGAMKRWNGLATISTPWTDPNLRGSYSCWRVGQYVAFAGYERVRQGKIHFAGEHCSINYQGFMEGAAEEGARAAREILADCKRGEYP